MATYSPRQLVRFMSENFDLVEGLCRFTTHSQGDVEELIHLHAKNERISPRTLVEGGLLDMDEIHARYAVSGYLKAFMDRLLQRRHLVDSKLIEGAVRDLENLHGVLVDSLQIRSYTRVADLVLNIRTCVEALQGAIQGNLEAIHRATEDYRKHPPRSAKERWGRIRELWESYVLPMQDIFMPDGPFDAISMTLRKTLQEAEERSPQAVLEDFQWAGYYLRRLGAYTFRAYQDAAREVQPLYEQAKRNARVALSASALISAYHRQALHQGMAPVEEDWNRWFGFMDPWDESRSQRAFGTGIATWLAQTWYRRTADAPPPVQPEFMERYRVPLSERVVMHRFKAKGGQADDLLPWLRAEFPEATLREILRAYHFLLKGTDSRAGGKRRIVHHPEAEIRSNVIEGTLKGGSDGGA